MYMFGTHCTHHMMNIHTGMHTHTIRDIQIVCDRCQVGFNSLIGTVVYDYEMESAAIVQSDDHNFIAVRSHLHV
jgi:hypothetical protein